MTAATQPTPTETQIVTETTVACDGGGGALGHPTVYLEVGAKGEITCPYCSRHFKLDPSAPRTPGH